MAEEAPTLNSAAKSDENAANPNPNSSDVTNEGTIQSIAHQHSDISVKNLETTSGISTVDNHDKQKEKEEENENSLEFSHELMEKGSLAFKDADFPEAAELFSRALEIRVAHYGELAPECIKSYYKYGLALLYKAQEEADPFGAMPKKDDESRHGSIKDESGKNNIDGESSMASVSSNAEQSASSSQKPGTEDVPSKNEGDDEESDTEETGEAEEDESDLDLAWKMLDLARAISEKHAGEAMDTVDILSALAEVSLEREDIETSLSDYQKALSILESLVEPDNRYIAELNFRICLCLEVGSKAQEAIPYCQKAISICKSRMQRLTDELKSSPGPTSSTAAADADGGASHSSITSQSENSGSDKQAEIETLRSLSNDLEKKLEDLQQLVSNPTSILSDILGLAAAKAKGNEQASASASAFASASAAASSSRIGVANNGDFDSPTVSSAHTNGTTGVTHLGVVGRGVKRVNMNSENVESSTSKRPALDPKPDTGDSGGA